MIWLLATLLLVVGIGSAEATERFATNNGLTSGACTSQGTACTLQWALGLTTTAGDIVTMLDGTYQGSANMLSISTFAAGVSGSSGNPIIVRALNDGGVFIDGQSVRRPFEIDGQSYWTFQGFDAGNAGHPTCTTDFISCAYVFDINSSTGSTGLTFQRMVGYNAWLGNNHIWSVFAGCISCLFEDIAGFGTARNIFLEGGNHSGSILRRAWFRWDGTNDNGAVPLQTCYNCSNSMIYENVITVWTNNDPHSNPDPITVRIPAVYIRDVAASSTFWGLISYATSSNADTQQNFYYMPDSNPSVTFTDVFVDIRDQTSPNVGAATVAGDITYNRVTSIKNSGQPTSTFGLGSNHNECSSLGACPNFYTGDTPGTGSRACFEYSSGSLTSTKLWPWLMDDRIKAAITRAGAAALSGSVGSGYAANTVTSEIVNRYGSVPTACLTGSSFTPSFPVASDFPSVTVRDDFNRSDSGTLGSGWTELLSDTFSIVSSAAAGPSTGAQFARALYSDTKMQVDHEVYATFSTLPASGSLSTRLVFAAQDLTVNNQYRVQVNRTGGSNTTVSVVRIDSGGNSTTILSPVDLGIEAVDGNSFGVRVSGTTISVYWKWTDDIWYRIGQFTDSNLSSLPSTGIYGGIAGGATLVIDNYGAGPFVDQPAQEPPSPPASVGAGRFGTTFPGVR